MSLHIHCQCQVPNVRHERFFYIIKSNRTFCLHEADGPPVYQVLCDERISQSALSIAVPSHMLCHMTPVTTSPGCGLHILPSPAADPRCVCAPQVTLL